ncbi:MAG: tetraacyldisaccharide 4'-kinase [Candidatus Brocadia sp.]|jgi:tetraacyldisaccharide 4'-kinase|nr:MAG: tetraacyldisaccharide 4'-kinase [Candidatus Brocadia sp. UTAMX2]UJS20384.1 MAG: tetraacyldisaccharide 4'-kinase [Candidatus Brocadia sp.]
MLKTLYPLSKIYGFVVKTRIFFYKKGIFKSVRLPIPVISVGNITLGGTGKTPVIEYIAHYLQKKGKRVAILSRGYAATIEQEPDALHKNFCNDEHLVFQENIPDVPHLIHKDRVKSGLRAIGQFQAQYLLLDDGFQHLRLARDINMVTIDALNPFGFGYTIPRGMLREPLEELRRADLFVLTHTDQCGHDKMQSIKERLREIAGHVPVVETVHKPIGLESSAGTEMTDIRVLQGKRVFAFCAIGNPESFRKSIEGLGGKLLCFHAFPDHHVYTASELRALSAEAKRVSPEVIMITQKDRVKIKNVGESWDFPLWTLKIEIRITKGCEIFEKKMNALLNGKEK